MGAMTDPYAARPSGCGDRNNPEPLIWPPLVAHINLTGADVGSKDIATGGEAVGHLACPFFASGAVRVVSQGISDDRAAA